MPAPARIAKGAAALVMLAALTVTAGAQETNPPAASPAPAAPAAAPVAPPAAPAAPGAPSQAAVSAADKILGDIGVKQSIAAVVPGMMAELEANVTRTRPEIKDLLRATLRAIQPEFDQTAREAYDQAATLLASQMSEKETDRRRGLLRKPVGQEICRGHARLSAEARRRHRALARQAVDRHRHPRPSGDEEEGRRFLNSPAVARERAAESVKPMAFDVDFFVIGAGSGGVRAARIAAVHGAKTLVAEESRIGGTCVIRGCIPKKLYVYASRFADDFRDAAAFGWSVGEPKFDWPTLVAAKDKEISRLSDAYRANLERSGAKLVEQRATVVDPHRVRLADGREVSAGHILIACGSRPTMPDGVEGIEHAITSNEIFDLPVFPRRLLVVGGGYIAVEFAALFQRLGAEVTQVMRAPNILRHFDDDMRVGLRDAMAKAGSRFSVRLNADADREAARRLAQRAHVRRAPSSKPIRS